KRAMIRGSDSDDRRTWRNVAVLVFAQAVLGSQLAVHIILGGLAGAELAPERSLATLPISVVVLVSMLTAPAASLLKAISWVFAGGLLSALIGPEIVRLTSTRLHRCLSPARTPRSSS